MAERKLENNGRKNANHEFLQTYETDGLERWPYNLKMEWPDGKKPPESYVDRAGVRRMLEKGAGPVRTYGDVLTFDDKGGDPDGEEDDAQAMNDYVAFLWDRLANEGPDVRGDEVWCEIADEIKKLRAKLERVWLDDMMDAWPKDGASQESKRQLEKDVRRVMNDCRQPGQIADRCEEALLKDLSMEKYRERLEVWYKRLEREAFLPFWRKHLTVLPDGRTVKNSLNGALWEQDEDGKYWWYLDGVKYTDEFPPGTIQQIVQAHGTAETVFEEGAKE